MLKYYQFEVSDIISSHTLINQRDKSVTRLSSHFYCDAEKVGAVWLPMVMRFHINIKCIDVILIHYL